MAGLPVQNRQLLHVSTSQTTPTPVPVSGRRKFFRIFRPLKVPDAKPKDHETPLDRRQIPNAPSGKLDEPITAELDDAVPLRHGSLAFRISNALVEGYDELKERLGIHASPMARLERTFLRQKTTDWARAMGTGLEAVLLREGYSAEFRGEVLALKPDGKAVRGLEHEYVFCGTPVTQPDKKVERLFSAAFALLQDADSKSRETRLNNSQVLDAIRLMNDLIPKLSPDYMSDYVKHAPDAISKGSDAKKLEAAKLFARMCNSLGRRHAEEIFQLRCEISHMNGAAAEEFIRAIDQRQIIDIGPDQPGRKVA